MHMGGIAALALVALGLATFAQADGASVYTSLREGCTRLAPDGPFQRSLCLGEGSYQPIVMEDNLRETLAIQDGNTIVPLMFFAKVSAAPSRLSDVAEWRFANSNSPNTPNTPTALVVTLNTDTNNAQPANGCGPGDGTDVAPESGPASYTRALLIVIKLDPTQSCVIDSIEGNDDAAHDQAEKIADQAAQWGCV